MKQNPIKSCIIELSNVEIIKKRNKYNLLVSFSFFSKLISNNFFYLHPSRIKINYIIILRIYVPLYLGKLI